MRWHLSCQLHPSYRQPRPLWLGEVPPPQWFWGSSPPQSHRKIWKLEYVDLNELLPSCLGAPELTMLKLFTQHDRAKEAKKKIQMFEQWVARFNTLVSVMAARYPDWVKDMLAYSSLIAKAHADYEDTQWLLYDNHFHHATAAKQLKDWSEVDSSLWTLCFTQAKPRNPRQPPKPCNHLSPCCQR